MRIAVIFTSKFLVALSFSCGYLVKLADSLLAYFSQKCKGRGIEFTIPVYIYAAFHPQKDKNNVLAYRIRKSEVFVWDRNSYLTCIISPQKETFHVNLVCIGCIGCHATLSLG